MHYFSKIVLQNDTIYRFDAIEIGLYRDHGVKLK